MATRGGSPGPVEAIRRLVAELVADGHCFGALTDADELRRLAGLPRCWERSWFQPGHFTASGVVLDWSLERTLLIRHRKLEAWLQPGGHFETSDRTVAAAAAREVAEETGMRLDPETAVPLGLDVHRIPAWGPEPEHLHLDLRLVFRVGTGDRKVEEPELEARWFGLADPEVSSALGPTLEALVRLVASAPFEG